MKLFRKALPLVTIFILSSCATTKEISGPVVPMSVIPTEILQSDDLFKGKVKKIGFCDLLALQNGLNGQMVEVEGLARSSYHYGYQLHHNDCPGSSLHLQHRPELAEDRRLMALKKRAVEEVLEDWGSVPVRVQGRLFFFPDSYPRWILLLSAVLEVEGFESGKVAGE